MDWLTIEGVPPWDGRYEFDLEGRELTTREWSWIKRFSGYMPLTIEDGFRGADPELFAAFAIIALARAGRVQQADIADVYERIADAPFAAAIGIETDEPDDAGVTPDPPPSSGGNGSTSGPSSPSTSESPAPTPPATGRHAWGISPSPPTTSAT